MNDLWHLKKITLSTKYCGKFKFRTKYYFYNRHYQYEQKLARLLWKVDFKDLLRLPDSMEYNSPYNYQERVSDF